MKIVIDIPEGFLEDLKALSNYENLTLYEKAILEGQPLPKGHGDLIDRSELLKGEVWGTFGETGYDAPCIFKTEVNDAPTIIAADKEDAE